MKRAGCEDRVSERFDRAYFEQRRERSRMLAEQATSPGIRALQQRLVDMYDVILGDE